ncbi:MAG: OB-fold nucleic acid binding domain-containing protein [Armatimonadota bacterium]
MNKLVTPIIIVALLAAGIWYVARPQERASGGATAAFTEQAVTPIGQITKEQAGQDVTIEGTIEKECPSTGCWAIVKDDSGQIRIDTQAGGFTLPLRSEGSRIKVQGIVKLTASGDVQISAKAAEVR